MGAITFDSGHAGSSGTGTLKLGGDVTVNASADIAILDGQVELAGATRTFDVGNGAASPDLNLTAIVSGTHDLIKTGGGQISISGANTYTGATTVNDGNCLVGHGSAFGATSSGTTVSGSGSIQLVGTAVGNEGLTLNKASIVSTVLSASGVSSWAGDIVLDADAAISTGFELEFSGAISGSGGIVFNGYGDLTLSGSSHNLYAGETVVKDGQLLLDKNISTLAIGGGSLAIGDEVGAAGSAVVQALGSFQIASIPITVNADGLLDLNSHNDTIGNSLTLNGGGEVQTGSGTLSLQGPSSQITCSATGGVSSTISGAISLGNGTCTMDVSGGRLRMGGAVSGSADISVISPTSFGTLSFFASNTFTGSITVEDGSLLWLHDDWALGSTNGGTAMNDGSYLGFSGGGVHIESESLTMNSAKSSGAFWLNLGTNVWSGPVTLLRDTSVGFFTPNAPMLTLAGPVSGPGGLTVYNSGTLVLSGDNQNSYTGTTTVAAGVLELDGANVIRYGTLIVGSNDGAAADDVVRFSSSSPIHSAVDIVINRDGLIDFDDYTDELGDLLFDRGRITTGTGTLLMYGDLEAIETTSTNWTSYISGNVYVPVVRTFDIDTATAFSLPAAVVGGGGIAKTGGGQLFVSSSNSYEGVTTIDDGTFYVDADYALGETTEGTTVSGSGSLILRYDRTFENEDLTLDGTGGSGNFGALYGLYGSSVWGGDITLAGDSRVTTLVSGPGDGLELGGAIGGSGALTLEGDGTVRFTGGSGSANTYAGDTTVNAGTLELSKSIYNAAIPGDLIIGDGVGGADADVVRLLTTSQIPDTTRITIAGSGLFDMNDLTEYFGSLAGSGHVDMGSGDLRCGTDGTSSAFSGLIEGTGDLEKTGIGTLELSGNNTYSGDTTIYDGTLLVNGSQSSSDVIVQSSGTLGGIGTVGVINSGGTVAPGASAGQLGSGSTGLQSGSTFELELDGHLLTDYDQLDVNGTATLLDPDLSISWGFVPAKGDEFTIVDNDGADAVVGTFNGLPEGGSLVADNVDLQITYVGGTGNDIVLAVTNVVPLEALAITSVVETAGNIDLGWEGGIPFFEVEKRTSLMTGDWQTVTAATRDMATSVPADTSNAFYRVTGGN